jgi:hypothetical protein
MAKWPNHFISDKQFKKRPNGNPDASNVENHSTRRVEHNFVGETEWNLVHQMM